MRAAHPGGRRHHRLKPAELAVVFVIGGAAAAIVARPYLDAASAARDASALGVAGELAAGTAINAAARMAKQPGARALGASNACQAEVLQPFLAGSGATLTAAPAATAGQFQIGGSGDCSVSAGNVSVECSVTPASGKPARATLICAR